MIDWAYFKIKQDDFKFIVYDELNGTEHIFSNIEACAEFIKKELIYVYDTYKDK